MATHTNAHNTRILHTYDALCPPYDIIIDRARQRGSQRARFTTSRPDNRYHQNLAPWKESRRAPRPISPSATPIARRYLHVALLVFPDALNPIRMGWRGRASPVSRTKMKPKALGDTGSLQAETCAASAASVRKGQWGSDTIPPWRPIAHVAHTGGSIVGRKTPYPATWKNKLSSRGMSPGDLCQQGWQRGAYGPCGIPEAPIHENTTVAIVPYLFGCVWAHKPSMEPVTKVPRPKTSSTYMGTSGASDNGQTSKPS